MTQLGPPVTHFRDRRAELAAFGYRIEEDDFGTIFFVNDAGKNPIDVEDVLVANWQDWKALLEKARVLA